MTVHREIKTPWVIAYLTFVKSSSGTTERVLAQDMKPGAVPPALGTEVAKIRSAKMSVRRRFANRIDHRQLVTSVILEWPSKGRYTIGYTYQHPLEKTNNARLGMDIAFRRALEVAYPRVSGGRGKVNKAMRRQYWQEYHKKAFVPSMHPARPDKRGFIPGRPEGGGDLRNTRHWTKRDKLMSLYRNADKYTHNDVYMDRDVVLPPPPGQSSVPLPPGEYLGHVFHTKTSHMHRITMEVQIVDGHTHVILLDQKEDNAIFADERAAEEAFHARDGREYFEEEDLIMARIPEDITQRLKILEDDVRDLQTAKIGIHTFEWLDNSLSKRLNNLERRMVDPEYRQAFDDFQQARARLGELEKKEVPNDARILTP